MTDFPAGAAITATVLRKSFGGQGGARRRRQHRAGGGEQRAQAGAGDLRTAVADPRQQHQLDAHRYEASLRNRDPASYR